MAFGFTTIVWSLISGGCLAIGFIHLLVWLRRATSYADLAFFGISNSVAALILCELYLMHSPTPEQYAAATRWIYVPITTFTIFTLVFFRFYLGAKRLWLAYAVAALRCAAFFINFHDPVNLFYLEIVSVKPVAIWGGETLYVGLGPANPWQLVGQLSTLLFMIFVIDAIVEGIRHQKNPVERRRILVIGLSIFTTIAITITSTALIHWGIFVQPFHMFASFIIVVLAISSELSKDLVNASILSTKLAAANIELEKNQQHINMISEAAAVGMWEWDVQRDSIWVNDQASSIYGFDTNESINLQRFLHAAHEDDRIALSESVTVALGNSDAFQREYRIAKHNAEDRWVMTQGRIEKDQISKKPLVVRGISLDISEQKHMQHLSRVTLLNELIGPLAHELNQPLAAILSNSQAALRFLAQADPNLDEIRAILQDISADDKRAGDVIQNLRSMLKKEEMRPEKIEANELVMDVVRFVRSDMLEAGIQHTLNLSKNLPTIEGIRVQLQQVLLNLLMNACDAMRNLTGVQKNLFVSTEIDSANCVIFRVNDQGDGIAHQHIDRVFEPFFTTKTHGLGLGLVVCRRIVDAHGGKIWAEKNGSQGASFCFSIPANVGGSVSIDRI